MSMVRNNGSAFSRLTHCAVLFVCVCVLSMCIVSEAWADMGAMSGASTTQNSVESEQTQVASDDADEQLGLMPRLFKLTGESIAASSSEQLPVEQIGAVFPNLLSINTTPSSISTGVECHMDEVCGYDPCTCGKPDAWGHCACGGFEDVTPTVSISVSDPSIACVMQAFGQTWIVPIAAGSTTVTITAELIHYKSASYAFEIDVLPFGVVDAAIIAFCVLAIAALGIALVFAVRGFIHLVRRRRNRARAWAARAEELKVRHPLTWRAKLSSEKYADSHHCRRRRGKTSPFLHDVLFSSRSALPVFVAGIALFAVLVPVSTCAVNDISVFNVNYTHEQLKYQLYAQSLAPYVNAAAVVLGAVLAIVLFRFLLVKRATTAFFSVGISRVKLFLARLLVGVACVVVCIGVPFAVSLALNVVALGWYDGQLNEFFYTMCGYIVVALVAFALTTVAISCAGTLFETCAFAVAMLLGVTVVLWGTGVLAGQFLVGNAAGASLYGQTAQIAPSLLDANSWLNPLLFFADEGANHQYFKALHPVYYPVLGNFGLIVGWLLVFFVLAACGMALFCRRKGEQAEMAGKAPIMSLFAVAVFGLAAFCIVIKLLGQVDVAVALVVATALFLLVSLVLLFGPLRGRTPRRITFGCVSGELVVMLVTTAVVAGGAFGFASYIPQTEEVESVEVSYNGSPSYLTQGFSGVSGGASYYYTSYRTYFETSSIDIVRSLHGQLADSATASRETNYEDFESSVVPYDVVLRYHMKDGSETVRYYSQATIGELSAMLSLDNDEHAHELETAAITGDSSTLSEDEQSALSESPSYNAYRNGYLYAADGALNRIMTVDITDQERTELLSCMAEDLSKLSASERYAPSQATKVCLMFTLSPELDVSSFGYSFSNTVSYITDSWTHTMSWLKDHDVVDSLSGELDSRVIEQLTFQLDDPYASINKVTQPISRYFMAYRSETSGLFWITQDYGSLKVVEDQAKIAEVLPNLRTGCYMTGGYLVQAKLRGLESYVYFYLPADLAPSYL
jgi:ABC-2 type transport system permease protein